MLTTESVLELYRRYEADLKAVRRRLWWFHRRHDNAVVRRLRKLRLRRFMLFPALDDLEAEITSLLIRDRRPRVIVEMSPNAGWSTTWILSALRDNADGGRLWSYDLVHAELFPRVKPGTVVSVHDVFHRAEPSEEGQVVLEWLARNRLSYWTASPLVSDGAAARITEERMRLGITYVIRPRDGHNPMLFFEMGEVSR